MVNIDHCWLPNWMRGNCAFLQCSTAWAYKNGYWIRITTNYAEHQS
jgi:hypothetical protein